MDALAMNDALEDTRAVKIEPKSEMKSEMESMPAKPKKRTRRMTKKALEALQKARDAKDRKAPMKRRKREAVNKFVNDFRKKYARALEDGRDVSGFEKILEMDVDEVSQLIGDRRVSKETQTPASESMPQDIEDVPHRQLLCDLPEQMTYANGQADQAIAPVGKIGTTMDSPLTTKDQIIMDMRKDYERINKELQRLQRSNYRQGIIFE